MSEFGLAAPQESHQEQKSIPDFVNIERCQTQLSQARIWSALPSCGCATAPPIPIGTDLAVGCAWKLPSGQTTADGARCKRPALLGTKVQTRVCQARRKVAPYCV